MDLCKVISDLNCCYGRMAAEYAVAKTFGRTTDKMFVDLARMNLYLKTLESNIPEKRTVKVKTSLEGQYIDFSALRKENNTLILDTPEEYSCVEIRQCLTDAELQKIVEEAKKLCSQCNC